MADSTNTDGESLPAVIQTLTQSLSGSVSSLPTSKPQNEAGADISILPSPDGISLLDTKNEIFLSYLQNLVLLLIIQIRAHVGTEDEAFVVQDDVRKKISELRIYLDRGVRPLEGKLKYQIDKVLKAAEDSENAQRENAQKPAKGNRKEHKIRDNSGGQRDDVSGTGTSSEEEEDEGSKDDEKDFDELAYRPNIAAFAKNIEEQEATKSSKKGPAPSDGIYRPPRIKPTALPTTTPEDRRAEREARRTAKSSVIDEFVNAEMSSAPMAQPSIGSTIRAGGRTERSEKDREKENERRSYEETNFIRLPKESKKERARRGGTRQGGFGGEEWRGLGQGADRIERLTRRSKGSGGALERSRKRRATEDGPRGDGYNVGEHFEKRRKKVASWKK